MVGNEPPVREQKWWVHIVLHAPEYRGERALSRPARYQAYDTEQAAVAMATHWALLGGSALVLYQKNPPSDLRKFMTPENFEVRYRYPEGTYWVGVENERFLRIHGHWPNSYL